MTCWHGNWHLVKDADFPGNYGCVLQRSDEESGAATNDVEVEVDLRKNVKLEAKETFLPVANKKRLVCWLLVEETVVDCCKRMKASVYCECQARIDLLCHTHTLLPCFTVFHVPFTCLCSLPVILSCLKRMAG